MSRHTPAFDQDQADLVAVLDSLTAEHDLTDVDPDAVDAMRVQLAELGVWTLGVAEQAGGGGANETLTSTVFSALGHRWASLGWAAVQAHAAAEVFAAREEWAELLAQIHAGRVPIAVVDGDSSGVTSSGIVRVDAAGREPHVVILDHNGACIFTPDQLDFQPLARTGLGGALTRSVQFTGAPTGVDGVDTDAARVLLRLGAAAVAAGIADAATQAAVAYTSSRHQFGDALTALPTVRDTLFDAAGATAAALRATVRSAAATPWQAAGTLDSACETAVDVATRGAQAHGGYGYLTEYPAERLLRDAVSLRAAVDVVAARRSGAAELVGSSGQ